VAGAAVVGAAVVGAAVVAAGVDGAAVAGSVVTAVTAVGDWCEADADAEVGPQAASSAVAARAATPAAMRRADPDMQAGTGSSEVRTVSVATR
jgi:hypothetical protein